MSHAETLQGRAQAWNGGVLAVRVVRRREEVPALPSQPCHYQQACVPADVKSRKLDAAALLQGDEDARGLHLIQVLERFGRRPHGGEKLVDQFYVGGLRLGRRLQRVFKEAGKVAHRAEDRLHGEPVARHSGVVEDLGALAGRVSVAEYRPVLVADRPPLAVAQLEVLGVVGEQGCCSTALVTSALVDPDHATVLLRESQLLPRSHEHSAARLQSLRMERLGSRVLVGDR
mmetsp:Transcript_23926/g.77181  ORF Transcript_23926/g.77181 Transcript_23926/m.77181 type:complete len:230 (-) Transcript_23926:108-797(-)